MSESGENKPTLTACYIAKDAEKTIGESIKSVLGIVDAVVVVVDARTTDNTREVCVEAVKEHFCDACPGPENWPLVTWDRHWDHNFSNARNDSFEGIETDYVMVMDADEVLAPGQDEQLREALLKGADLYTMPLFLNATYGDPNYEEDSFGRCTIEWRHRIFKKSSGARFKRRVHEQLTFPTDHEFVEETVGVKFHHLGSMTEDKSEYYSALMLLDHIDDPSAQIPAIMLADRALIRHNAALANQYISKLDPEAIASPGTLAKYYIVKGKICQTVYIRTIQTGEKRDTIADEAVEYYLKARDACPVNPAGATHAAILLFAAYTDRGEEAAEVLRGLLKDDPSNVCCAEILTIWERFGQDYADFQNRLDFYINNMGQDCRREALGEPATQPGITPLDQLGDVLDPQAVDGGTDFQLGDR